MSAFKSLPVVIKKRTTTESEGPDKEHLIEDLRGRVEGLLQMLTDDPDDIKILVRQGERTTIFTVSCSKHNLGRILGKGGKTILSIRTLVMSVTGRYGFRSIVEVPYFPDTEL